MVQISTKSRMKCRHYAAHTKIYLFRKQKNNHDTKAVQQIQIIKTKQVSVIYRGEQFVCVREFFLTKLANLNLSY